MEIPGPDNHRESPQNSIARIVSEGRSIGKEDGEENEMSVNLSWKTGRSLRSSHARAMRVRCVVQLLGSENTPDEH
jgi:hypothetical protein